MAGACVEIEVARHAGYVAGVGAGDGAEHEHCVFDVASHGAKLIESPAEGHGAGAWNAAVGGAQAGNSAAHAGADDAASGLAANGEAHQSGGGGCARARTGTARTLGVGDPRVHGLSAEPDVIEGECAQAELGNQHGAGIVQALHDDGVFLRNAVAEGLGAVGGGDAGGVEQVLAAPGDAVQWAAVMSGGDLGVGLLRLFEGEVAGQGDDATQLGIELLEAVEIDVCKPLRGEPAVLDPLRELGDWGERDVLVARGQRTRDRNGCARSDPAWA